MRICHELIKEQYKVTYLSPLQVNNAHEQIDRQESHLLSPVFPWQVQFWSLSPTHLREPVKVLVFNSKPRMWTTSAFYSPTRTFSQLADPG